MFLPVSLFIGLRYSKSQSRTGFVSFITFFSIAGILLGVASLITVVSVMNGLEGDLKKRILGLVPQVVVEANSTNTKSFEQWPTIQNELLKQAHVTKVTPFTQSEALIQSKNSLQGVMLLGVLPEHEQDSIVAKSITYGDFNSLSGNEYNLILGESLARKLHLRLGDDVRVILPNKTLFTPVGRVPVQRVFKVSGIFNVGSDVDDTMVYIHSKNAAKLNRKRNDGITHLRLYLDDAFNADTVVSQLNLDPQLYSVSTWSKSQGVLFSAVKMEKNMMWLMLSLIIAVAAFNIVSALVMVVIDKQGEIGILRTLGINRRGILQIFITQGMVNGFWGVLFGSVLGMLLALNLNELLAAIGVSILGQGYGIQQLPIQLKALDVFTIVCSALLMSFLATLYPAYRASNTQPAEVLCNE